MSISRQCAVRQFSAVISRMRDFASSTSARNPGLCFLWGMLMTGLLGLLIGLFIADPANACSRAGELRFDRFISSINVIHAIDDRFAARPQASDDQRRARPQLACDHLGS